MSSWRLLASSLDVAGNPTLLIKHDFQTTRYTVHITDLTFLWTETLDRKGIIKRALNEDTSIDPSEGSDQLRLLLNHVRRGLDGEDETTLEISSRENSKERLDLLLTSNLPSPLKTLSWNLRLKAASEYDFSREVLLPILGSLFTADKAVSSLLNKVKDRENLIARINSNLSSTGRSMVDIFWELVPPKASKDAQYAALLKKVPGLQTFDEDSWRDSQEFVGELGTHELCEELFRRGLECRAISNTPADEAWWTHLGAGVTIRDAPHSPPSKAPFLRKETSSTVFQTLDDTSNTAGEHLAPALAPFHAAQETPKPQPKTTDDNNTDSDSDATASTVSDLDAQ
ncbi:MAG: hypothetical protein LQ340_001068, partial [Diploschistes diacapsis]